MPKISIVTPCCNSAAFVAETLASVRAQTLQDWEHVVVDDGSTDNSAAVVQHCAASEARLKLVRQANGGVCNARNTGFAAAAPDSEYVYFLDADDCPEPKMLQVLTSYLDTHSQVGLAYCDYRYMDSSGAALPTPRPIRCVPAGIGLRRLTPPHSQTPFAAIFSGTPVLPSCSLVRRRVYDQSPQWDEAFGQHHEEVDLFLCIALMSEIHNVPQTLLRYRQHPAQSTKQAERFHAQQQKLDAKWSSKQGLTAAQQTIVERALRFRDGRMIPYAGALAGTRHLRRGELAQAARFYGGALKRYAQSFLP